MPRLKSFIVVLNFVLLTIIDRLRQIQILSRNCWGCCGSVFLFYQIKAQFLSLNIISALSTLDYRHVICCCNKLWTFSRIRHAVFAVCMYIDFNLLFYSQAFATPRRCLRNESRKRNRRKQPLQTRPNALRLPSLRRNLLALRYGHACFYTIMLIFGRCVYTSSSMNAVQLHYHRDYMFFKFDWLNFWWALLEK